MISQLSGTVVAIGATWIVVDVNGVGLRCQCTPQTAAEVRLDAPATVHTSLVVRQDALTLFGFATADERDAFDLVQSASGVGPKIALACMSVLAPEQLREAILQEDLATLCRVPGIGRKGAQKMVIELKEKVNGLGAVSSPAPASSGAEPLWREQVRSGLEGLGWSTKDAEAACERIAPLADADPQPGIGQLMRAALQSLAK